MRFSKGIITTHLFVPRDEVDLARTRRRLTVKSRYNTTGVEMFRETRSWFGFPLYCGLPLRNIGTVEDKRSPGISAKFNFTSTLRDYQVPMVAKFKENRAVGKTGFVVEGQPALGKTVVLIKMIQSLQRTALVVVPTRVLLTQWIDRFLQHTDLKRSDIGSVIGRESSWRGKKVVIGLVHSLALDYLPKEFKRYFGQVWFDEVHSSVPPDTFGPVACMFPAKYRGGASATLDRSDGMHVIFENYLQEIKITGHNQHRAKATILLDEFHHNSGEIPKYLRNANQRRGVLLSLLSKDVARNSRIAKHCHLLRKSGRRVVILSDRIDLLRSVERILKGVYEYTSKDIGYYVGTHPSRGRISDIELKRVAQVCNIILATFGLMKQGSDLKNLSGMILATPQSDPRQSKGRVEGDRAGDLEPIVIDLTDTYYTECVRWAKNRVKHYRQSGCRIRRIS
jgi:hypothetical protein